VPISSVKLRPGVDEIKSALYNEAGIATSNLIRFAPTASQDALVQKMGGWVKYHPDSLSTKIRALHPWADLSSNVYLAVAAEGEVSAIKSGARNDISARKDGQTAVTLNFSTTSGGSTVTVVDTARNLSVNDIVNIRTPVSVGGLILQGFYQIASVVSADSYTITAKSNATATVAAGGSVPSFTTTNGSSLITVTLNGHGLTPNSTASFPVATSVGGLTVLGDYFVISTPSANTYTISAAFNATSAATVSMNANKLAADYWIGIGPLPTTSGYGAGAYGSGTYGIGTATTSVNLGTILTATDWTLDNYGEYLVGTPENGPVFIWGPRSTSSNLVPLAAGPVVNRGAFVAMPQRQIIAYGSSFSQTQDPLLIRWCEVEDFNQWIATAVNQAGSFRLSSGSKIIGAMQVPGRALVWTDIGLWAMSYIGGELVYSFTEQAKGCGLIAKKAAGNLGANTFWMSQKQFYRVGGDGVQPLSCPVWDVVFQNINMAYADKIRCAVNSQFNEIMWFYPSAGATENDSYVKFNNLLNVWDYGTLGRTAWFDQSILGSPVGAGTNNAVYQHEIGYDDDGAAMNPSFETGYYSISEGQDKIFVDRIWPDMTYGTQSGPQTAQVLFTFEVVDYPGQSPRIFGPYTMTQAKTFLSTRFRARLVRIKVSSSDAGSFWRLGLLRYRFASDGRFA
jgi:hypothetical protein